MLSLLVCTCLHLMEDDLGKVALLVKRQILNLLVVQSDLLKEGFGEPRFFAMSYDLGLLENNR